ncbi:hypothetical protein M569_04755 [Genlisea aurea]|uniref:AB hydrolase-1 domain-containing protein n=1 Tax=Genlisea aurea TaxID=192259 RepID=S8E2U9_9LAMI|nr:hypothetical protein M569_04755 [Genlisea aurea]
MGDEDTPPAPAHFVLIHGIGGGAWCWYKIRCLMENSGYRVTCLDLRGSGVDPTDANTIRSFDHYNSPLVGFLSQLPDGERVILVGHSAGGLSLTDAIHRFGKKKIKLAVYVGATMLRSGFASEDDIKIGQPDLSEFGEFNELHDTVYGLGQNQPPTSVMLNNKYQRKIIYQLSPLEDYTLAAMLLRPGPMGALAGARFSATTEGDEVPRVYIKTMHDNVLKREQQEAMILKWPPSDWYALESDHSPFFSSPFLLLGLLLKASIAYADR